MILFLQNIGPSGPTQEKLSSYATALELLAIYIKL